MKTTYPVRMSATTRYFKACDLLDAAMLEGKSQKRVDRLKAWVDKLSDESATEQIADYLSMRDGVSRFLNDIKTAFAPQAA